MNDLAKIGATMRELRRNQHISQEDLAFDASIDRSYLSEIETGKKNLSITVFLKVAHALKVEPYALLKQALSETKGLSPANVTPPNEKENNHYLKTELDKYLQSD